MLIITLLLSGYLKEDFHSTAYSINVYVSAGPQALRLTRLSRQKVEAGEGSRIDCTFVNKITKKRKSSAKSSTTATTKGKGKGKLKASLDSEEEHEEIDIDVSREEEDDTDYDAPSSKPAATTSRIKQTKKSSAPRQSTKPKPRVFKSLSNPGVAFADDDEDEDVPWNIDEVIEERVRKDRAAPATSVRSGLAGGRPAILVPSSSDAEEGPSSDANVWSFGLSHSKKRRSVVDDDIAASSSKKARTTSSSGVASHEREVVVLSDSD